MRSVSDAAVLVRVVLVMGLLPFLARLSTLSMLRWLDRVGHVVSRGPAYEAGQVVSMVRTCGGLKRWSFQDNCISQSLTLFALLNRDTAPLDVVFGVERRGSNDGGPRLGRRHVWLERDGEPVFERQPLALDRYVVQMRYRATDAAPAGLLTTARVFGLLTISGAAAALTTVATIVRTKIVAVLLGPAGIAIGGQVSQATVGLGWLATFGTSAGTTRYLAEAVADGDESAAATVVRSSAFLIAAVAAAAIVGGLLLTPALAVALFGSRDASPMVRWLLGAVPAVAATSASAAMLRSVQQVGRLAAAQSAGAIAAVAAAPLVLQANAIVSIAQFAFFVSAAQACAVTTVALPLWKRWMGVRSRGISLGVIAGVAGYGAANVVMGLATTAVFLFIGRSYLAAGAVVPAAHIAALAWFGEPVASILAAGIYASTFPAYCASTEAAASRVLANSLRALVLVSSAGLVATAVFAPVLIPMLFDSRFAGIVPLLPLQLLATYGRCLTIMLGVPLLARGRVAIVTGLHLAWAAAIAIGATAGLAGPRAYVLTVAAVTGAHALVLALVLARLKLAVSRSAYAWLVCGAIPLLLVMVM